MAATVNMASGRPPERDVVVEASNLAAAFIDVDGLHTDDELWAFIQAFAPHMDSKLVYASPGDVRSARLVDGKKQFLDEASMLFEILVADDHRNGTTNCWKYYEDALAIAHAVSALDLHPSTDELEAIDRFRSMLLDKMDNWEVPRPGTPVTGRPKGGAGSGPTPEVAAKVDTTPARPVEELLAELDQLVGMDAVKAEVRLVTNLLRVQRLRKERGLPVVESSHHLVFTGNPGTGKTTVARLVSQLYRSLGVVEKGQLVETDRASLVAGYVGQTAIQVTKVAETALGGVLLIDEAYALARGNDTDFGQEAIDTLVKIIEDHREDLVVIAAGYPEEMHEFIESNPGLRSRFPKTIEFPDYSSDELVAIFSSMTKTSSYTPTEEALQAVRAWFESLPRDKGFGNARLARNLFEAAIAHQAGRIVTIDNPTNDELCALTAADVAEAAAAF